MDHHSEPRTIPPQDPAFSETDVSATKVISDEPPRCHPPSVMDAPTTDSSSKRENGVVSSEAASLIESTFDALQRHKDSDFLAKQASERDTRDFAVPWHAPSAPAHSGTFNDPVGLPKSFEINHNGGSSTASAFGANLTLPIVRSTGCFGETLDHGDSSPFSMRGSTALSLNDLFSFDHNSPYHRTGAVESSSATYLPMSSPFKNLSSPATPVTAMSPATAASAADVIDRMLADNLQNTQSFVSRIEATPKMASAARQITTARDIGWTIFSRDSNLSAEYRALVCSLRTLATFASAWLNSEDEALLSALNKYKDAELGDELSFNSPAAFSRQRGSNHFTGGDNQRENSNKGYDPEMVAVRNIAFTGLPLTSQPVQHLVVLWVGCLRPDVSGTYDELLNALRETTANANIIAAIPGPVPPQGLIIFAEYRCLFACSLASATSAVRSIKARQLELCDTLARYQPWSPMLLPHLLGELSGSAAVLARSFFELEGHGPGASLGQAVGLGLVNVRADDPECIKSLRRLTQLDTLTLGHRRGATETLRLLVTHPEAAPLLGGPAGWRGAAADQSPSSIRRVSVWCGLCRRRQRDVPAAWKHLTTDPHEARLRSRNFVIMEWLRRSLPGTNFFGSIYHPVADQQQYESYLSEQIHLASSINESDGVFEYGSQPNLKRLNRWIAHQI